MVTDRIPAPADGIRRTVSIRLTGGDDMAGHRLVAVNLPDGYFLRVSSLDLHAATDVDGVVVTDTFSTVYGAGAAIEAAIDEYLASLFETLIDLERQEAILAPGLQRELASLRRYVSRVA